MKTNFYMIIGDFDDKGLSHSYQNAPPGYSEPQLLYHYHYEGWVSGSSQSIGKPYIWNIEPPFYIIEGQGTNSITCELMPINTENCSELKSSVISLQLGKWQEGTTIYYKRGPKWKIEGNKTPKILIISGKTIKNIETYELIPNYDQTGFPTKCATNPENYTFSIKNGEIINFYGNIPPNGNPKVDIFWYQTGSTYLSFYSSWTKEKIKFPTTIDIYVSSTNELTTPPISRIETGEKKLWLNENRPTQINSNIIFSESKKISQPILFTLEQNLKEVINSNFPLSWEITGNINPIIQTQNNKNLQISELYTLIPNFDDKIIQLPNKFYFDCPKGKIKNFYRTNNNIILDIIWLETGTTYISFYTKWENEIINYNNSISINITKMEIAITQPTPRIETGEKKLWKKQERPIWIHGSK